jgi:hypothetical protein
MRQGPFSRLARAAFVVALVAAPIVVATAAFADDPSVQSTATVGNGEELREQWAIGSNTLITLTADIDLGDDTDLCNAGEPLRSDSNSSNAITIDGQGLYGITQTCDDQRVLHDENVGETVTLTGLTHFSGGEADGHGGGLRTQGPVNVVNSTINDNRANGQECELAAGDAQAQISDCEDGDGGGIFAGPQGAAPVIVVSFDINITNSSIEDNWAFDDGGGVYTDDTLTVASSQFNRNIAAGYVPGGGRGGGAFGGDAVSVTDSSFTDNEAQCNLFFNNLVDGTCGAVASGGGFFTYGSATVSGSTFTSNAAWDSGGGFWAADADVANSTFTGNTAGGLGSEAAGFGASQLPEQLAGGAAAAGSEEGSQDCDCVGGGFAVGLETRSADVPESGAQVVNSTFIANSATCNAYCWGAGGGFLSTGGATVSGSTFGDPSDEDSGNLAGCYAYCGGFGGGAYVGSGANVDTSIFGLNFAGCIGFCGGEGGGLFVGNGIDEMDASVLDQVPDDARIAAAGDGTLDVVQTTFAGNAAGCDLGTCGGAGGGVFAADNPTVDITASTFNDNESFWEGGAIAVNGVSLEVICEACGTAVTITNSTVTGNTSGWPAAISVPSQADTLSLVNDTIDSNSIEERETECVATVCSQDQAKAQECDCLAANVSAFDLTSFGTDITHPILAESADVNAAFDDIENCWFAGSNSDGFNFSDDDSCGFDDSTDNVADGNDPMLGALANNGGPTQTMLPQPGSPLIDAIQPVSECQVDVDQRGVTRPQIKGCDTGSVEVLGASLQVTKVVTGTNGVSVPASGYSFQVTCTDGSAATLTVADATNGGSSEVLSDILPGSTCSVVEDAIVYTNPLVTTQPTVSYDPATGSPLGEGETSVVTVTNNYEGINLLGVVVDITPRFTG